MKRWAFIIVFLSFAIAILAAPDEKTAAYEKVKEYTASYQARKIIGRHQKN